MAKQVYNVFFTQEKWGKVNKYNKDLLEDFILELKASGKSLGTIAQYRNDIRIIFIYILEEIDNKKICDLKKKHFRNLVLYFKDKGMSNARVNRLKSAVSSMLEFASNEEDYEDDIVINYAGKIKGLQKDNVRDIIFLTWDEVMIIHDELKQQQRYQEMLLLSLAIDSAGRRNELHQVEKDSITENGNFTNEVVGKRNKRFRLMYHEMTKEAYKLYMQQRGQDDLKELWLCKDMSEKTPADKDTLYSWVVSWRKLLEKHTGEYKPFNAHSFRHISLETLSDGTHYVCKKLNKVFDINELKLLAHHESIDTTNSYLRDKSDDMLLEAFGINKEE